MDNRLALLQLAVIGAYGLFLMALAVFDNRKPVEDRYAEWRRNRRSRTLGELL